MEVSGAEYWDLEAILAGETQMQASFTVPCAGVGRIVVPGSEDPLVAEGTDVELPLWLASALAAKGGMALTLPQYYGRRMARRLQAGAGCEDLRLRCPYYYGVGSLLNTLLQEERLPALVESTWRGRYKELLVESLTGDSSHESGEAMSRLTAEEQQLFEAGRVSVLAFERYRYTRATLQRAPSFKRKWGATTAAGEGEDADKENAPRRT